MNLIVLAVLGTLVVAFARARADEGEAVRRWVRDRWRAFAEATGLAFAEEPGRGLVLRGRIRDQRFDIVRAQLRLGEWAYCASTELDDDAGASPVRAREVRAAVVHHQRFPFPSLAASTLPRTGSGDDRFDRRFEIRVDPPQEARSILTVDVRRALEELAEPELSILDGRVAVVWSIVDVVPTEQELEAVRTILEAIAAPGRRGAYR